MSHSFWENKKVLVTGHTGFKGSWLSLWLQQLNAKVIGLSLRPPTTPNLFTKANVESNMVSIIGDINDYSLIEETLREHEPDIIFHLAAQSLVRHSYAFPIDTYATNVMGTVHLLEAARKIKSCKSMVCVTTDKCYQNNEWHWGYRENDSLGGHDPYSSSKACAELVCSAYRSSFQNTDIPSCGIATARAGNVIGGGDWAKDRLIPDIISASYEKKQIIIRNPHALRPWQHVLEPLQGYMLLAEQLFDRPDSFSEAWNFGPDDNDVKPVSWVVETMLNYLDNHATWVFDKAHNPHEATFLKLDSSKAKNRLDWRPRWELEKALKETTNWFRAYHAGENMEKITISQIIDFCEQ